MKLANTKKRSIKLPLSVIRLPRFARMLALMIVLSLAAVAIFPAAAQEEETPSAPGAGWTIQVVEDPPYLANMTDRSLRFDATNNPHIAFGGDHLYYARWDTNINNWIFRVVDNSPNVGRYASIALDNQGNPRISYYDAGNGALKFAFSQDKGYTWNPPIVVSTFGPAPTVTADPDNPTIEQALQSQARTRFDQDSKFSQNDIAGSEAALQINVGGYTSTATDGLNRVHVSYYDWTNRALMYARWDGVTWTTTMVDGKPSDLGYDVGKYSSIAVESSGVVHISYMDEKYDGLKYAVQNNGGWNIEEIDTKQAPDYRYGGYTSLVLNSDGDPYISYQDWQNFRLMLASPNIGGTCTGASCHVCGPSNNWTCRILDDSSYTGNYTSIALDDDNLRISYYNASDGSLEYAKSPDGRNWTFTTLLDSGDVGLYTSIASDGNNRPGISYYSASTGLMGFVRWNGSKWVNYGIIYAGELGPYSSLAINAPFNTPYVSYFNDIGDALKLAYNSGTGWRIFQAFGEIGGSYSSLKFTSTGEPRVAFYDFTDGNYDLLYAYPGGNGQWVFQTVDSTDDVGMYPSLALDSQNRPYISYYDDTNNALKFAYWNGSAWLIQTIDNPAADVGKYNSLTLNKNASDCYAFLPTGVCPMISYYDATNKTLKAAFLSVINAWAVQAVDNTTNGNPADVGQYSSIGLDSLGALHISYYDATNGWLKHAAATKGASAWDWSTKEVVDSSPGAGQFTSLAVDPVNTVWVSYYDAGNGDLKYATLSSGGIWNSYTLDGASTDVGIGTSLALFPTGEPAISYYDATNGAIKYATLFSGLFGKAIFLPAVFR